MIVFNVPKKITGSDLMYLSLICLTLLLCLPISICLPGVLRNILQVLAIGGFVFGLLLSGKEKLVVLFIFFVCLTLVYFIGTWSYKMSVMSYCFNAICCWVYCIGGLFFLIYDNEKKGELLIFLVVLISTITAVTTILGVMQYPLAVRDLGKGDYLTDATKYLYRRMNIAGWSQMYGMVFVLPSIITFYKKNHSKILVLSLVVCEISIIFSQLTFAMLLSVFVIFFSIFKPSRKKRYSVLEMIFIEVILLSILFLEEIIKFASGFVQSFGFSTLSMKLLDLYHLIAMGRSVGDAAARFDLYSVSLHTFFEYPIGGAFLAGMRSKDLVAYHSEFFDLLGYFGILGLILMVIFSTKYVRLMNKKSLKDSKYILCLLFLAFIAIFIFNPVFYSPQIFLGTFLLPSLFANKIYRKDMKCYE